MVAERGVKEIVEEGDCFKWIEFFLFSFLFLGNEWESLFMCMDFLFSQGRREKCFLLSTQRPLLLLRCQPLFPFPFSFFCA